MDKGKQSDVSDLNLAQAEGVGLAGVLPNMRQDGRWDATAVRGKWGFIMGEGKLGV